MRNEVSAPKWLRSTTAGPPLFGRNNAEKHGEEHGHDKQSEPGGERKPTDDCDRHRPEEHIKQKRKKPKHRGERGH